MLLKPNVFIVGGRRGFLCGVGCGPSGSIPGPPSSCSVLSWGRDFFSSLRCYVVYSSVLLSWLTSRYYLDHRVERGGSLFVLLIFPDHLIGARWCLFVFLDPGSRVGLVYPRSCRLMHVSFLAPASFCCWCTSSYSRWPCFWKLLVEDSWLGGCTSVASILCVR